MDSMLTRLLLEFDGSPPLIDANALIVFFNWSILFLFYKIKMYHKNLKNYSFVYVFVEKRMFTLWCCVRPAIPKPTAATPPETCLLDRPAKNLDYCSRQMAYSTPTLFFHYKNDKKTIKNQCFVCEKRFVNF